MRIRFVIAAGMALGLAACASGGSTSSPSSDNKSSSSASPVMPAVTGKQLDVAESDMEKAGFDEDEINIVGGGRFGVVLKSNWQVCGQSPAPGQRVSSKPKLTIDRSCTSPSTDSDPSSAPSSSNSTASEGGTLTRSNNADLKKLLVVSDNCSQRIGSFAERYPGREIEFDGSITALAPHDDYKTRFDIGIAPGGKGSQSSRGPSFQFQDVNIADLHLKGANGLARIVPGMKLRVVAEVGEYVAAQCLLLLRPISVRVK